MYRISAILLLVIRSHSTILAQSFSLNAEASSIAFTISNFGIDVKGSFTQMRGKILFSEADLDASRFDILIEASSIVTGIALRDKHLKGMNYFDVEKYPVMTFHSKYVRRLSVGNYILVGNLVIKNRIKEITVPFKVSTRQNSISFDGMIVIDRSDFGIGKNSLTMSDEVNVQLHVIAERAPL